MAITKGDVRLEKVEFLFDEAGVVMGLSILVNYAYLVDGVEESRQRRTIDVWAHFTPEQKATAIEGGRGLLELAKTLA